MVVQKKYEERKVRLSQKEYCHNCDRWANFEFEDVTLRQVIHCPLCGHEHFREIDEGTLINIRINQVRGGIVRFAKMPPLSVCIRGDEPFHMPDLEVEERRVMGQTEDGYAILEKKEGDGEARRVISERRWGSANS